MPLTSQIGLGVLLLNTHIFTKHWYQRNPLCDQDGWQQGHSKCRQNPHPCQGAGPKHLSLPSNTSNCSFFTNDSFGLAPVCPPPRWVRGRCPNMTSLLQPESILSRASPSSLNSLEVSYLQPKSHRRLFLPTSHREAHSSPRHAE